MTPSQMIYHIDIKQIFIKISSFYAAIQLLYELIAPLPG